MGRVHVAPHSLRMLCCLFLESFPLFCYVVLLCLPVGVFSGYSDSLCKEPAHLILFVFGVACF